MQYRHEIKHLITPADAVAIRRNMSAVASVDPHAREEGCYRIRSLYFDDLNNTALWEKLDGVNERRKFRIRYYNEDLSFIMLECKMKRDNVGCKLQERLTEEELRRIMDRDLTWMACSGRPLLVSLYVEMVTKGRLLVSAWAARTLRPGLEMVKWVSGSVQAGRVSMPPENTSWKISTKGMMVMAVVVVWASVDTHSDNMSEA